jgi:hypothetical protein
MTGIDIINADHAFIGAAQEAMIREQKFIIENEEFRGKRLDEIVRFRDEGIALWRSLSAKVEGTEKERVELFIGEQEIAVEILAALLTSQDNSNRKGRKSSEKRKERFQVAGKRGKRKA